MKIGDLLLLKGVINKKQLQVALSKQAEQAITYNRSIPLGKILIEENYVSVDEIAEVLNEQAEENKEKQVVKKEKVMPTEIGELADKNSPNRLEHDIVVKEIDNIKSMGDLKIISYKMDEYSETFKDLKALSSTLTPLASDLEYIKGELEKLKNKKIDIPEVDLSGIDDCKNKLDALSNKIGSFEERLVKLEKRNSGGSRF